MARNPSVQDRYSDEALNPAENTDQHDKLNDMSAAENAAFDQISAGFKDMETNANTQDGQTGAKLEKEKGAEDKESGFSYKPDTTKQSTFRILGRRVGRRRAILGGAAAGSIVTILSSVILLGPTVFSEYLNSVLTGKVGELQTNQQIRYRKAKFNSITDAFSRDGRLGGPIVRELNADGYRFSYDADGNVTSVQRPDGIVVNGTDDVGEEISDFMDRKHPFRTAKWKTKRSQALMNRYKIPTRSIVQLSANDLDDPKKTVNRNLYEASRATDDVGFEANSRISAEETDAEKSAREAAEEIAEGDGFFDDTEELLRNGEEINASSAAPDRIASKGVGAVDNTLLEEAENVAAGRSVFSRLRAFSTVDIAGKLCTIKNKIRASVTAARTYTALYTMRLAASYIGANDAGRAGLANAGLFGQVMLKAGSLGIGDTPIGASSGFQYALQGSFSKSRNDLLRESYAVDGKLTGVLGNVQKNTDFPTLGEQGCGRWQNPIVQIGAPIIEVGITVFSGGTAKAAITAGSEGAKRAIQAGIRTVFTRSVAKSLAKTAAIELSFEGIIALASIKAEQQLAVGITGQERGEELGNILVTGAGGMSKQNALDNGLVPATPTQYISAHNTFQQEKREEILAQSFFDRFFSIGNTDSLAFYTVASLPLTTPQLAGSITNAAQTMAFAPTNMLGSTTDSIASLVGGRTYAQTDSDQIAFDIYTTEGDNSGIELATDPGGNLLPIMREDIFAIDPEENIEILTAQGHIDAETLEPNSDDFREHVANCVQNIDTISVIEGGNPNDPKTDCLAQLDLTVRFKAHLAYLGMLDSVEASFLPEVLDDNRQQNNVNYVVSGDFTWPVVETKLSAGNSLRASGCLLEGTRRICDAGHPYRAHDLFAAEGTTVVAAAAGEVIRSRVGVYNGNRYHSVQVYDEEQNITYFYQHLSFAPGDIVASVNDTVVPGDVIGYIGNTEAAFNTPPHLHFDVSIGKGRVGCTRSNCPQENKDKFIDVSDKMYEAWDALQ